MILTERTINIIDHESIMDSPVVLYRGDKNVELKLNIKSSRFKFRDDDSSNFIESAQASYGQLIIQTPNQNEPIFSEITATKKGYIIFVITAEMIDEIDEVGAYTFQVRLLDSNKRSRATIPPVVNGIEIREPITSEDSNVLNSAVVGLASAANEEVLDTFDEHGDYAKTNWKFGDKITAAKLKKAEDGIYQSYALGLNNSSQLKNKVSKGEGGVITNAMLSQEVKESMTGGSVAVVGVDTILTENIVDRQVTPSKTDFISLIAPIFEKNKCVSGHIIEDGTIASSGWTTTDFIPICKGHVYKIQGKTKFIALYDSSKNIIEGSYSNVSIPNRQFYSGYDGYVRFSFVTLDSHIDYQPLDTLQIYSIQGNHLAFNIPLMPNFLEKSIQDKDLASGCINARHFEQTNRIYRLKDLATMDGYIVYTNGYLFANSNYCYTEEPISILEDSTYFIKHAVPNIGVYYDEDMNFLSLCNLSVEGAVDNIVFTTPVGAKYLRINTRIVDKETQYIALGTRELTQEEFDNPSLSSTSVSVTWLKTDIDDAIREEFKQEIFDEINLNQPSSYSSDWLGKTFVSLGDSITWQDGNAYGQGEQKGQIARGYQTIIKEKLRFASYLNKGVSGKSIANGSANGPGTNTTCKTVDYSNFDLVIIAGGTNDFKLNIPLGELGIIGDTNFNTNTFYGAYRDMVEHILKQKPTVRIVLFTPLQRDNSGYDVNHTNSAGCKLIDYVKAVKEIGEMYGLPVCDMYANSGFTKLTLSTYTMDGLHPNDVGYLRMGNYASKFINNIGN